MGGGGGKGQDKDDQPALLNYTIVTVSTVRRSHLGDFGTPLPVTNKNHRQENRGASLGTFCVQIIPLADITGSLPGGGVTLSENV